MKKIDESNQISEAVDTIVGEVISDEKPNDGKQQTGLKKRDTYAFGSFITKSNDLIQRTKYSLPRNEQKILFMLLSKMISDMIWTHRNTIRFRSMILQNLRA